MYEDFVKDRITALRLKKGVSEYQMSFDLGHSRGYIYNISSGKALPPLREFFVICDYFGLTPQQFFDESAQNPLLLQQALDGMKKLSQEDLQLVMQLIDRLKKEENK
ncbi:MAG: helix-turn-helix domain-containing protein [Clostridia bacterium]|nr:helix-turn-helix domain-containing protein [Clostridia bacterium]